MRFLDRALDAAGVKLERLDQPTASTFLHSVEHAQPAWFLMLYTGHGLRPNNAATHLCLGAGDALVGKCASASPDTGQISVNDCVLDSLPKALSGVTLVIDACRSAQVDPRRAPVPTSVISSSPYTIDATSLFGDRLALALGEARSDPNCDGLVTDQELFDALLHDVYSEVSIAENRTYPKLRRQATSHIPLPILPEARKACQGVREEMARLVRERGARWGRLADALNEQLELAPLAQEKRELPRAGCSQQDADSGADYFVVDQDALQPQTLRDAALRAGLCAFPESDLVLAEKVARFAIFSEVFQLSNRCGWVSVTRLRDRRLMTTLPADEVARAMPARRSLSTRTMVLPDATDESKLCQFRYQGIAPAQLKRPAHCGEPDGQCFLEPCPNSRGLP